MLFAFVGRHHGLCIVIPCHPRRQEQDQVQCRLKAVEAGISWGAFGWWLGVVEGQRVETDHLSG